MRRFRRVWAAISACLAILIAFCVYAWGPLAGSAHRQSSNADATGSKPQTEDPPGNADQPPKSPEIQALQTDAEEVAERLIAEFPRDPEAVSVMAMVHHRFGNTAEASKWFQKCLQLDPRCADAYHGMGSMALRKGDYQEAAKQLRQAISLNPMPLGPRLQLADALKGAGDLEGAVAVLQESIERIPGTSQLHYALGDAYDQLGDHRRAKAEYAAALKIDPEYGNVYYRLGTVCAKLGDKDEADTYMKQFAERGREFETARIEWVKETTDVVVFSQAVADICTAAAQVYRQNGRPREAEEHLLKAASLVPKDTVSRNELLALYQSGARPQDALKVLQELVEIEPENEIYRLQRGGLLAGSKRFEEAERSFLEVIEIAPEHADGYLAAAKLYVLWGQKTDEAVRLAKKAVELAPTDKSYVLLSAAHKSIGDVEQALAAIDKAIELNPQNPEYRRMRDLLVKAN